MSWWVFSLLLLLLFFTLFPIPHRSDYYPPMADDYTPPSASLNPDVSDIDEIERYANEGR